MKVHSLTVYMTLVECLCQQVHPLWVCSTIQLCNQSCMNEQLLVQRQLETKRVFSNFQQDCFTMERYGMLYEDYITNLLDHIITLPDVNNDERERVDSTTDKQMTFVQNKVPDSPHNQQSVIPKQLYDKFQPPMVK